MSLVLFVAVTAYALLGIQPAMDPLLGAVRWLLAALFVVAIVASVFFAKSKDCDLGAFIAQSGAAALLVLLLAASMFPNFVVASADSVGLKPSTTAGAASSELTLMWMTIITCVGLPLVLVYHVIIYRTFRGRVKKRIWRTTRADAVPCIEANWQEPSEIRRLRQLSETALKGIFHG